MSENRTGKLEVLKYGTISDLEKKIVNFDS